MIYSVFLSWDYDWQNVSSTFFDIYHCKTCFGSFWSLAQSVHSHRCTWGLQALLSSVCLEINRSHEWVDTALQACWLWHFPYQLSSTEAMAKFTLTLKGQGSTPQCTFKCSTCLPLYLQNSMWEGISFVFLKEMCKICILITYGHEQLFCWITFLPLLYWNKPIHKNPSHIHLCYPPVACEKIRASFNLYSICINLLLYLNASLLLPAPPY